MSGTLHIVSFDNPYPPDYGGAIDVFYKLKYLDKAGVKIILHLFAYGRNDISPLKAFAKTVYIYPRPKKITEHFSPVPFIVKSRMHPGLLKNLMQDDHPVLFEGVHTTGFADKLIDRSMFLRSHNLEAGYYAGLAKQERNFFKKLYYKIEAVKLKPYEKNLVSQMQKVFAVHPDDRDFFDRISGNAEWIPVFHPFEKVDLNNRPGDFILFHGNLSVPENYQAVVFLWENVLKFLPYDFVVAGKSPHPYLKQLSKEAGFKLIANPGAREMQKLIKTAKINLLYTPQQTDIKLKLLYALYNAVNIITNTKMISGTRLEQVVSVADSPGEIKRSIERIFKQNTFDTGRVIQQREEILNRYYNNNENARKIIGNVFKD